MALKPLETHELELRKKSGGKVKKKSKQTAGKDNETQDCNNWRQPCAGVCS